MMQATRRGGICRGTAATVIRAVGSTVEFSCIVGIKELWQLMLCT